MATHRPQDTGFSPESAFQFTLDVLDAAEDLTAQRRPATPKTLTPLLRARAPGRRPTLPQLQAALTQVTRWREPILTRELLAHRRPLLTLRARTEAELNRWANIAYLTVRVREIDCPAAPELAFPGRHGVRGAIRPNRRPVPRDVNEKDEGYPASKTRYN